MIQHITTLPEIIARQRSTLAAAEGEPTISGRELARRTAPYTPDGVPVGHGTIGRYLIGQTHNARSDKLAALAHVLATEDHPPSQLLREMQEAADLPVGAGVTYTLPPEIYDLNDTEWQLVCDVIRGLSSAKRTVHGGRDVDTTLRTPRRLA